MTAAEARGTASAAASQTKVVRMRQRVLVSRFTLDGRIL